ncbi:hypothetical protein LO771_13920 [Streptacidiphilus sp. ASG 303]|uniref:hypothetical protein n=1 Tax=Streptacidiphilus sp. ASG 303 TaxID=2896847 RepID=UPI001E56990B|nr:hypothetical protein [Streptacidiphilus sp. ASG 303]MCD0483466.1 hypothetical protein [Streptacidiphilus sp. ASG 303]
MRSTFLTKSLLAATLGCAALSACGSTAPAAAGAGHASAAPAAAHAPAARQEAPPAAGDPQMRFLDLVNRTMQDCASRTLGDKGDASAPQGLPVRNPGDAAPRPEDLPGWEGPQTPRYGPGQTPPGTPDAHGDIAVPLPADAPEPPAPTATAPRTGALREVPLSEIEACEGTAHADRITAALRGTAVTGYDALQAELTGLDYPAERIHRMPQRLGEPRARIDLRFMGGNLALEVTATRDGAFVEPFGAPETEDVRVADVRRAS